jgi:hypothetical protein
MKVRNMQHLLLESSKFDLHIICKQCMGYIAICKWGFIMDMTQNRNCVSLDADTRSQTGSHDIHRRVLFCFVMDSEYWTHLVTLIYHTEYWGGHPERSITDLLFSLGLPGGFNTNFLHGSCPFIHSTCLAHCHFSDFIVLTIFHKTSCYMTSSTGQLLHLS